MNFAASTESEAPPTPPGPDVASGAGDVLVWRTREELVFRARPRAAGVCLACLDRRLASNGAGELQPLPVGIAPTLAAEGNARVRNLPPADDRACSWSESAGWSEHRLLPVPGCTCGGRAVITSMGDAISRLFGPVHRLTAWQAEPLDLERPMYLVVTQGADRRSLGSSAGELMGAAYGELTMARNAAIAECLERYCASFQPETLPLARGPELGAAYLAPMPGAFAGAALGPASELRWVRGQRLLDGEACWVQASAVYFPYVSHDREPKRSTGSSEGLAAGDSWLAACEHAAFEVVERDTFMRAWRYGTRRWRLPNPYASRPDLSFLLLDNRFGVPVVAAFSESERPPFCLAGLAARRSVPEAVAASAREAVGARCLFPHLRRHRSEPRECRYLHAVDVSLAEARRQWMEAPPAGDRGDRRIAWSDFVQRVPDAVAVDVTTPDVRSLGVQVARVVIPGCHGFEPVHGLTVLGGNPVPIPY